MSILKKDNPVILTLEPSIRIGKFFRHKESKIGYAIFDITGDITIDKNVDIYDNVVIFIHTHSGWMESRKPRKETNRIEWTNLHIHKDAFIGYGSIIVMVEDIGEGAIIGAGSVLTKNVPPFEVWAGNPARKIGERHE